MKKLIENNNIRSIVKFLELPVYILVAVIITHAFIDDIKKAIWVGCFILIFYFCHEGNSELFLKYGNTIKGKALATVGSAIIILGGTQLLFAVVLLVFPVSYCDKGISYSEMLCKVENATNEITEPYVKSYDESISNW